MKEQITLEALAGFLACGLKFQSSMDKPFEEYGKQPIWTLDGINEMFGEYCLLTKENRDAYAISSIKPLVYPLSSLTEEHINMLMESALGEYAKTSNYCPNFRYSDMMFLIKNHYDIHNWIPRGLAIDKRTVK